MKCNAFPSPHKPVSSDELAAISEDEEASSTNGDSSTHVEEKSKITQDDKLVVCSRAVVMAVLMSTALIISGMTHRVVSQNERDTFHAEFKASARQVSQMGNKNVLNIFTSVRSLSNFFISAASQGDQVLPFLTVKDFEPFGESIRKVSKASMIAYSPILRTAHELNVWSTYAMNQTFWITEGRMHEAALDPGDDVTSSTELEQSKLNVSKQVYKMDSDGREIPESGDGIFAPIWQTTPVPSDLGVVNYNLASNEDFNEVLMHVLRNKDEVLSKPIDPSTLFGREAGTGRIGSDAGPTSLLLQPVLQTETNQPVRGIVLALIPWKNLFDDVLPDEHSSLFLVADTCGQKNSYIIDGAEALFVGPGDLHDPQYNNMKVFFEFQFDEGKSHTGFCHPHIYIFPTKEYEKSFYTNTPIVYASIILLLFVFTTVVFIAYDWFVTNRQNKTEQKANKTNAIVEALFPGNVAAQLFQSGEEGLNDPDIVKGHGTIAELYPSSTIIFADIAGFTAWSSMRDPHQVFMLLETIFQAFDVLAKKRGIYKVETIGDCYVAVCGVPKPNADHAVQMAHFATAAIAKFYQIVTRLELTLGPDTADLGMRLGMHSGPVTAGVLRGDRARFQLFGDTVNTAARIESSGLRGRIHISEQTALELIARGKEDWITRREDVVEAKGKGKLVTYWLKHTFPLKSGDKKTVHTSESWHGSDDSEAASHSTDIVESDIKAGQREYSTQVSNPNLGVPTSGDRIQRLVDWNCELLLQLLNQVVARREAMGAEQVSTVTDDLEQVARSFGVDSIVADEVAEIIEMPEYVNVPVLEHTSLLADVKSQLRSYVSMIASMYNDNLFHNFEHASHVTMSVNKLITRIVASRGTLRDESLHDHTYGITSDPMTQFAVVLSGLIHDLDHPGVPNLQLCKENPPLAERYEERSVAEQNSIDLAWNALLLPEHSQLRSAIFGTETELRRFRQLLVNSIIATDIFDKNLGALRKNRWNKAFDLGTGEQPQEDATDTQREYINRKATIVIEHLIQASDVAHTMQHWHVYQKWNQRLFDEMMLAYKTGRSEKDPSIGWYQGELGFFDHYIIPLAKKLKSCGVFGVCSDEYLNYALQNRSEWAEKGEDIVQRFLVEFDQKSSGADPVKRMNI